MLFLLGEPITFDVKLVNWISEIDRDITRLEQARWLEGKDFATGLKSDPEIAKYLSAEEIDACFDPTPLLRHVDTIMARFGL